MLLVLQIAQYEAVALEVKKLLLVLFWTVFRIMLPVHPDCRNISILDTMDKLGQERGGPICPEIF